MPEPDLIELFVLPLERLQVRYMISGSVAAMLYGEPRVTNDIDFAVFLRTQDTTLIAEAYPAPEFYVPPQEVLLAEIVRERGGQFNVIHADSSLKADFYPATRDEFNAWAFRNVRKYNFKNTPVRLSPPEYVIVRKLEFFREGGSEKHVRDIRAMLKISGELIDRSALAEWVQRQGVEAQWKLVQG
ncbi:MAG TPA: hypothetical protein VN048_09810 [Verrucomicrobiae bacterium]|jgi:hypothetical protein|nr:hypothetical protein [Verrucomicrobiae bacterium]